jgi:toxin-antitoxin system PIN domain toxin
MLMPDVNILVYAHRADLEWHEGYARWLEGVVDGDEPFALSTLVAVGFVRAVTDTGVPGGATPLPIALAAVEQLAAHPRCRLATPGPTHIDDVLRLCRAVGATGKHVADAQHAAIAIAEGATWATRDADFGRFEAHGLRWQHIVPD